MNEPRRTDDDRMKDEEVEDDLSEVGRKLAVSIFQGVCVDGMGIAGVSQRFWAETAVGEVGGSRATMPVCKDRSRWVSWGKMSNWVRVHVTWGSKRLLCGLLLFGNRRSENKAVERCRNIDG